MTAEAAEGNSEPPHRVQAFAAYVVERVSHGLPLPRLYSGGDLRYADAAVGGGAPGTLRIQRARGKIIRITDRDAIDRGVIVF